MKRCTRCGRLRRMKYLVLAGKVLVCKNKSSCQDAARIP